VTKREIEIYSVGIYEKGRQKIKGHGKRKRERKRTRESKSERERNRETAWRSM
jgi:hypothetical protein